MDKKPHFNIQFVCFGLVFAAILLQGFTHVIPMKPLRGFDKELTNPSWDELAKRNTGFREFFIRNYNQVAYSCFGRITNHSVSEGADRELYLDYYLNEINGSMLKSTYGDVETAKAVARQNVEETLRMIDTLRRHGKEFLFIFAPSKTRVYPEKMPESCVVDDFSLQEYYTGLFKEHGIPYIDFLSYFCAVKDTVAYPLFTRMGTHWAESTIPWVADTILRKMEELTHYDFPKVQNTDLCITSDYSQKDIELEHLMNLLFPMQKPAVPNPTFTYVDTAGKDHPGLLVIGDSYGTQLVYSGFGKVFDHWDFWVYNDQIQSSRPRFSWRELKTELDAVVMLEEADIVLGVLTAPDYYKYLYGFPKTVQNLYQRGFVDEGAACQEIVEMIKRDTVWYNGVVKQAGERHITVDSCLVGNALYFMEIKRLKNLEIAKQP